MNWFADMTNLIHNTNLETSYAKLNMQYKELSLSLSLGSVRLPLEGNGYTGRQRTM